MLVVAATAQSQVRAQSSNLDSEAIRSAFQAWVRVCEAGDADAYVTFITNDAVIMAPGSAAVIGRAAILPWARGFFTRMTFKFTDWRTEEIIVVGDTAIHRYTGVATMGQRSGGQATREDRQYVDVLRRGADRKWHVSHHIYNVVRSESR